MSVAEASRLTVTIDLLDGCTDDYCCGMVGQLKRQLDPAYSHGAAVMPLLEGWTPRRTARKRANRATRLGYRFETIERADYADDIHAANVSAPERQGRPMGPGYQERPSFGPNPLVCPRHHVYTYGVVETLTFEQLGTEQTVSAAGHLVAYLWLYRCGELAMVSSILGHADHLAGDVMYLLYLGMVEQQLPLGGTAFYNLMSSGTDGLRFFKERLGLYEGNVKWALS